MKYLDDPIRLNATVPIGPYTFTDPDGDVIDLTSYSTVHLQLKLEGVLYDAPIAAAFIDKAAGTVWLESHQFTDLGTWMAEFCAVKADGVTELPGEPLRFVVAKNVRDARRNEVLVL